MPEETERPQTSTRDYDELGRRLEAWLATRLPEGSAPTVSGLEVPSANGMSSETLLFDLTATENGSGPTTTACVARVAPESSAVPVFPTYDLEMQFRVMRLVAERTTAPVPRVLWLETDASAIGAPFFVMEQVEGQVPPDVMPYNFGDSWLFDASLEDQARLQESTIGVLAELHTLSPDNADLAFLDVDAPGETALRRHVAGQWAYYQWVADGVTHPLIERAFAWLDDHWPADDRAEALSWGDARVGNVLYRDFTPVGVLDWEMAGVAPPEVDLAWLIFLHRFFEDLTAQMGLPGMPHFLRRDDVAAAYEALTGHTPRDLDFYLLYAALRDAIVMTRVQQRAIRFGEAEPTEDLDDLIMHRTSLESMVAGTYWSSI